MESSAADWRRWGSLDLGTPRTSSLRRRGSASHDDLMSRPKCHKPLGVHGTLHRTLAAPGEPCNPQLPMLSAHPTSPRTPPQGKGRNAVTPADRATDPARESDRRWTPAPWYLAAEDMPPSLGRRAIGVPRPPAPLTARSGRPVFLRSTLPGCVPPAREEARPDLPRPSVKGLCPTPPARESSTTDNAR